VRWICDSTSTPQSRRFIPFLNLLAREAGSLRAPVVFQPERLSSYTERSSFMAKVELSIEEMSKFALGSGRSEK